MAWDGYLCVNTLVGLPITLRIMAPFLSHAAHARHVVLPVMEQSANLISALGVLVLIKRCA
jgi:hypothetical protein